MPPNSKNMNISSKESSNPKEVQIVEPVQTKSETKTKKVTTQAVEAKPVVEAVEAKPVVEGTPQKGAGKSKTMKASKIDESKVDIVDPPLVVEVTPLKGAGKTKPSKTEPKVDVVDPTPVVEATPQKGAGKTKPTKASKSVDESKDNKTNVTTATKKNMENVDAKTKVKPNKQSKDDKKDDKKDVKKDVTEGDVEGEILEKGIRSFKVQLPQNEEYTGRYTGLTPYQAANKALSKYFRENKTIQNIQNEITFSIRESTRGSKRSTYTYTGNREKLETPVKYSINGLDGNAREIIKEYKNKLTKVKKYETKEATV